VDDTGRARLTDFGFATVVSDVWSAEPITDGHAVRWAAPEVLDRERPVSKESDVYSFAMVVIEVLARNASLLGCTTNLYKAFTGKAPFHDDTPTTVAVGVLSGKRPERPAHPNFTDDLWDLIKRCWNREPERRPDISQVILCLQTTSFRRGCADTNDDNAADDATLSNPPRKKGFWFLRHRARQSSIHNSQAKQGKRLQRLGCRFGI